MLRASIIFGCLSRKNAHISSHSSHRIADYQLKILQLRTFHGPSKTCAFVSESVLLTCLLALHFSWREFHICCVMVDVVAADKSLRKANSLEICRMWTILNVNLRVTSSFYAKSGPAHDRSKFEAKNSSMIHGFDLVQPRSRFHERPIEQMESLHFTVQHAQFRWNLETLLKL